MKAIRYNAKNREDRRFNTTGREKNPNKIAFFATNEKYAQEYRFIYNEDGDVMYECERVEVELTGKFFDMEKNFESLNTYNSYIESEISKQLRDYKVLLAEAKTKKDKKMWERNIAELSGRKKELTSTLKVTEFQRLSDYERQNELIKELVSLGYEGYTTKNEVAVF